MQNDDLIFRVREKDHAHPSHEVRAKGAGQSFHMYCGCLASSHGALLCSHIVAVLRENRDLVMYGSSQFNELKVRSAGSQTTDPNNGYWQFYPLD